VTTEPSIAIDLQQRLLTELRSYAASRSKDVTRGAETPELAALLVEKYGEGMARAARLLDLDDRELSAELQRLTLQIDPQLATNREKRWAARPAGLILN
jgi:hypothetical protein